MVRIRSEIVCLFCFLIVNLFMWSAVLAQDLGNGFYDHGVACPVSNHRGTVATVDGNDRNVVLAWLFDHRGGYALLMIDAATGKSQQFPMPFQPGDAPYASVLSSKNKYYTLFHNNFVEFDPVTRAFTFHHQTMPQMAMALTEDDKGVIWAVTYPNSGIISFDPQTRSFTDFGYQYQQNWKQYPRYLAGDDKGWIYVGLGNTASQILAFDPTTRKATPLLEEAVRKKGSAYVYRGTDGKVYGKALMDSIEAWFYFYEGKKYNVDDQKPAPAKPIISGSQVLFHKNFPDGKQLVSLDLLERKLTIKDSDGTRKTVAFGYETEGALVMGVGTVSNGTIAGGAAFPMRFFNFNPKNNSLIHLPAFGQFNAITSKNEKVYFGVYPQGALLEWAPGKPWVNTKKDAATNPAWLGASVLSTHRPLRVLATRDSKNVILSGTPEYGYTGGGLLIWNNQQQSSNLLIDSILIPDQSTLSMVELDNGKILGGTTTMPGTGGEKKAKEAVLYLLNLLTGKIEWQETALPGVQDYSDMMLDKNGLVYGIADLKTFFVFDPAEKKLLHKEEFEQRLGKTSWAQSPRIFVRGKKATDIYLLFNKGIIQLNSRTYELSMIANSPVKVEVGGDYLDGKIYFVSGSHLCSYTISQNPSGGKAKRN